MSKYKHKSRKDHVMINHYNFLIDPLQDNYYNLVVEIYKMALFDIITNNQYAGSAKSFIKNNPYGIDTDFNKLIEDMKKSDITLDSRRTIYNENRGL